MAPTPRPLPRGLTQSGGVIMMQPVGSGANTDATGGESVPAPDLELHPSPDHALSAADHDLFTKAFDAADRGDWTAARGLADQGRNPVARRLITWRYLIDRNSGASFAAIDRFLRDHPDWPLHQTLFARAEHAIPDTMAPAAVLAWFGDREPITGMGKVRLGEALIAAGQSVEGRALIRNAWIEDSFEPAEEIAIVARHGDILTPDVDRQRLDHLLWRDEITAARREISRVPGDARRVAEARMALRTNPRAGERMTAALPQALTNDPGLLFARARVLRHHGEGDGVPALLVKAPTREMATIDPRHWWGELNIAARQAIENGDYRIAYRLVSDTGLREGNDFAEAEFMAGWIALRFLHQPETALVHFRKLADGVSRPISLGRAYYWAGRAQEAAGDKAAAAHDYEKAAQNPETFYGQLALLRIEHAPHLRLKSTPADATRVRAAYSRDDLTHAVRVLADLGEERLLRHFAVHEAERHDDPGYIKLLAADLVRMGFPDVAVRVAKTASYQGIDLLPYSHPVISVPHYGGPGAAPEHALVLGLIRQETEFNPDAVSRVGALGIMQLMPRTARRMARLAGLRYHHQKLKSDPHYNMQLGMTELSTDLDDWGGSYILAAAAYNAGAANVKKWIATYGDPRSRNVDPIDWIEQIPFSETRNYVQRVIENTEVYRSRLAGRGEPLQILADLYRPNQPPSIAVLQVPRPKLPPARVPSPEARPQQADVGTLKPPGKPAVTMAPLETAALNGVAAPSSAPDPRPRPEMTPDISRHSLIRPGAGEVILPKKRPAE